MSAENRRVPLVVTVALGLLLVSAGCTGQAGVGEAPADPPEQAAAGGGAAAACLAAVRYDGHLYVQVEAADPQRGEELDGAAVPGCNDTGGEPAPAEPVEAFAIEGVDTEYAVTFGDGPSSVVYVRADYAPGMPEAKPLPDGVAAGLGLTITVE